jgi:two-component system sensor histidine kinase DesK
MASNDLIAKQQERQGRWAWMWIAYTGFLFIDPFFQPTRLRWVSTIAAFLLFLAIYGVYIRCSNRGRPLALWMIAATFALGLLLFPINQGASCLFTYGVALLPFEIPTIRRALPFFGLGVMLVLAESFYFHRFTGTFHVNYANTFIAILLMTLIGGSNIFVAEQKRADMKLRAAQEENVTLAAVAERERIARDLHDVLGHTLSVIVLKAELAGRLLSHSEPDAVRAGSEMADVERIARTALAEVREAIGGYRSQGLAAEIEAVRRTLDTAGVTLIVDSSSATNAGLSAAEETVLALALREAVTNIVRHAKATTCRLRFISEDGRRRLVVEDDGQHPLAREGNGLRGMRERVEALGGRLSLERGIARDCGTRLLIDLPLPAEAAA